MPNFHLVDVFATERYAGNQLAVVESFGNVTDETMQAIAAEMNFSRKTYVESVDDERGTARMRICTLRETPADSHDSLVRITSGTAPPQNSGFKNR